MKGYIMKKTFLYLSFASLLGHANTRPMQQTQKQLMELASAFILSRAIHVAAEIKVADHMIDGPKNIQLLAQKTTMNTDALYRLLRLLASYGIFSHDTSNNFSLTPLAQQLVSTDPNSLWAWVTYHNDTNRWHAYGSMKHSI